MALGFGAIQEARYEEAVTEFAKMVQANPVFSISPLPLCDRVGAGGASRGRTTRCREGTGTGTGAELQQPPDISSRHCARNRGQARRGRAYSRVARIKWNAPHRIRAIVQIAEGRHDRDPQARRDPRRRRRRLFQARRRGRGPYPRAAAGAAQRPHRSDHRCASTAAWSSEPATAAIVEFRSVVDAVRCAIEVQNAMVERNAGVPEDRRIVFRIGIHLGDVVEESDGDLMGDGVNIAARLEGIAEPGAICLSEDAYRQVKSRLDLAVSDLGATQLKNIAEPIRAYSVQVGLPRRRRSRQRPRRWRIPARRWRCPTSRRSPCCRSRT